MVQFVLPPERLAGARLSLRRYTRPYFEDEGTFERRGVFILEIENDAFNAHRRFTAGELAALRDWCTVALAEQAEAA